MIEPSGHRIRQATTGDFPALMDLERRSFTELGPAFYPLEDIECALDHFQGLSLQLHYFVLTGNQENLLAAGGWSRGEIEYIMAENNMDGEPYSAVVRCLYVCPQHARRGLAQKVLRWIESDALSKGMRSLTLTASKTAEALYLRAGYEPAPYCNVPLPNGHVLPLRPMKKKLVPLFDSRI